MLDQDLLEEGDLRLQPGDLFLFVGGDGERSVETIDLGFETALVRCERHHVQVLVEFAHLTQPRTPVGWKRQKNVWCEGLRDLRARRRIC
jgi:hypothetical protein